MRLSVLLLLFYSPGFFTKALADRLNSICEIEVKEAVEGDKLTDGVALIAPGGNHMELSGNSIKLNKHDPELGVRPSVNRLFRSVARVFKGNTIGVVLTGMGKDGTDGAKAIKNVQGTIIAQDEESSVLYGMPKSVVEAGYADEVLSLHKIVSSLVHLIDV